MKALIFYAVYAVTLGAGLWLLRRLHRSGSLQRLKAAPAAGAALALAALMFVISEPQQHLFEDFSDAYYAAGAAVLGGVTDIKQLFERGVHGFVNLPIIAYVFVPFALLPVGLATAVFTVLGLAAAVGAWWVLVRAAGLDRYRAAILGLLFVLDGPLMNSVREGNTSHITLFAVALALTKMRDGREWTAGLLIGFAALFKLPLLIFGVYFVLRLRWRAAVGQAVVIGTAVVLSILIFGFESHVHWYEQFVAAAGKNPIGAFNVQSIAGFVARLERGNEAICNWDGHPLSALGRGVTSLTAASLYLAALGSAVWPRADAPAISPAGPWRAKWEIEFTIVLVLACVTSPLAWSHYYCWMLFPIAFLIAPGSPSMSRGRGWILVWVAVVVVVPIVALPGCRPLGPLAGPYRWLLSHYLLGGLLIWFLLVRELRNAVWPSHGTRS